VNRLGKKVWRKLYECNKCGASVGTHHNGKFPMGRMETLKVRKLRYKTHNFLNNLSLTFKENTLFYKNLGIYFKLSEKKAHIAMLSEENLLILMNLFEKLTKENVRVILLDEGADSWKSIINSTKSDNK